MQQSAIQRGQALQAKLKEYDDSYYTQGVSLVSDAEYDRLYREYEQLEKDYPALKTPDSPTERVGGDLLSGFDSFSHRSPLLSIENKSKELDELKSWYEECGGDGTKILVQPKLDGITLNAGYQDGYLRDVATRGTGYTGELVTENAKTMRTLPLRLTTPELIEVRGEAVCSFTEFMDIYSEDYSNPRNFVAGTIRQFDPKVVAKRQPHAIMYDLGVGAERFSCDAESLEFLVAQGFKVAPTVEASSWEELEALCTSRLKGMIKERQGFNVLTIKGSTPQETYDYVVDGLVLKVADLKKREVMGMTSKGPRYYFAYKFESLQAETTLEGIEWQIGRTGKITPVAKLSTVELGGTSITNATLNNPIYLASLGVKLGHRVVLERANDVIPYLVGPAESQDLNEGVDITVPTHCPSCHEPLTQEGANLFCQSLTCTAKLERQLAHAVGREALDLEGLGKSLLLTLARQGWVTRLEDLLTLETHADDLQTLPGYGAKKVANILAQLEKVKELDDPSRVLYAMGVPHVGRRLSRQLMSHYDDLEVLAKASVHELVELDGIAQTKAEAMVKTFQTEAFKQTLAAFKAYGLPTKVKEKEVTEHSHLLENQSVAITGTLNQKRKAYQTYFEAMGAKVSSSVSTKTNFVLIGADAGSKAKKAYDVQAKGADLIILEGDEAFETHVTQMDWPVPDWLL